MREAAALPADSVETVRAAFPALERRLDGRPVAYFDGPGGTQVPAAVPRAMARWLVGHNANSGWAYTSSREADATVASARRTAAAFLGCRPRDVVFGANMTTLTYHLSRTLGRSMEPGDEIVTTRLDHFANVAPWRALEAERGVTIREVPFHPETGLLDLDALLDAIGPRTRLVAVGQASNALGTVTELEPVVEAAGRAGARVFVDAVHAAPHVLPDVAGLGCDFLACSPYKFHGPHAGILVARAELLDVLDVPRLPCAPKAAPGRFETGTASFEALAGVDAALRFLASLGGSDVPVDPDPTASPQEPREAAAEAEALREGLRRAWASFHAREASLVARLWAGLSGLPGVRCFGPEPGTAPRTPTVAFTVAGVVPREVAARLSEERAVFVSHGDFYAAHVPEDLGVVGGLVRAGCACYTTQEEVDRLVEGVAALG